MAGELFRALLHPFMSAKPTAASCEGKYQDKPATKTPERTFALRAFASMSA